LNKYPCHARVYIYTCLVNSLSNIYLLLNHINHPSSQNNHLNKLLNAHIINAIKYSSYNITIKKIRAYINIIGNDKANKLVMKGALEPTIIIAPFHHIGRQTWQIGKKSPKLHPKGIQQCTRRSCHKHNTKRPEWLSNKELQ
jgi:hypothetical protein